GVGSVTLGGAALTTSFAVFERSLSRAKPPAGLSPALAALWWASKGEWETAHGIVMDDDAMDCAWVHAYLHRVEGDLSNARYWYNRAGKPVATGALEAELHAMTTALLLAAGTPRGRRSRAEPPRAPAD